MKQIILPLILCSVFLFTSCGKETENKKLDTRISSPNIDSQTATNTSGSRQ